MNQNISTLKPMLRTIFQYAPSGNYNGSIVGFGEMTREELMAALQGKQQFSFIDSNKVQQFPRIGEVSINCNQDSALVRVDSFIGPVPSTVLERPDFSQGLIRVITVDTSNRILMDAFMNEEAYECTQDIDPKVGKRRAVYFSRTREKLWPKGDESGNVQEVIGCHTLTTRKLLKLVVNQIGDAACHDGYRSCFYRRLMPDSSLSITEPRIFNPEQVYEKK